MAASARSVLPSRSSVSRLCEFMKEQPSLQELSTVWTKLAKYLSRVGLQHSPVFFAPRRPEVYQAQLILRSPFLLQTDQPATGVAPRSHNGKGRRVTAAQSAEQALSLKVLSIVDPYHRPLEPALEAQSGPQSLPLPATPLSLYSSRKDELFAFCHKHSVAMPRFYAYTVKERPKSCMALVCCGALTEPQEVVLKGMRTTSMEETLLDLGEVALYALTKLQLDEMVNKDSNPSARDSPGL